MSSLRQDILTGRWVILASDRGKRPNDFPLSNRTEPDSTGCPFCPGNEYLTPPEVMATGRQRPDSKDGPGWKSRVFPNKYPAVSSDVHEPHPDVSEIFPELSGQGRHEVIVYSPNHNDGPTNISTDHFFELLKIVRNRYEYIASVEGVRYVLPFWNHGPEAGATLRHPHMQMIGSPLVPSLVAEKASRQKDYFNNHGKCLLCDILERETLIKDRIIISGKHFTALTPWASRLPFEIMVLPQVHQNCFAETTDEQLADLAAVLHDSLRGLLAVHPDPPMNIIIHEAPLAVLEGGGYGELAESTFHWHLEVLPRLSRMAGFEAGTGFTINSVSAEKAARIIRGEGT